MDERTWLQKDGTSIPIKDMSDSHIINTINMLRRSIAALGNDVLSNDTIQEHMPVEHVVVKNGMECQIEIFEQELNRRKQN